ncbi:MAG: flagellar hook-basal body complex protein FliE, partial [bacterium]|nr:flagellar hook-basal body complex protein FliE [bacterium]
KSIQNYVSGKETSLHNTLISLEKAEVSFKLMMQVRSKLMDAYQQIMRTSV